MAARPSNGVQGLKAADLEEQVRATIPLSLPASDINSPACALAGILPFPSCKETVPDTITIPAHSSAGNMSEDKFDKGKPGGETCQNVAGEKTVSRIVPHCVCEPAP